MSCDVDEAMEGLRMSCDVGEAMESLENELCDVGKATEGLRTLLLLHLHHSSFSNSSFASPVSQDCHLHHLASCLWTLVTTKLAALELIVT